MKEEDKSTTIIDLAIDSVKIAKQEGWNLQQLSTKIIGNDEKIFVGTKYKTEVIDLIEKLQLA